MQINREHTSPNQNERPDGVRPRCIVMHATAGTNSLPWLTDPKTDVSAHYLIRKDGLIYALVPEERRAWHAGKGEWKGVRDVNNISVGIELENLNNGRDPYPPAQWAAAVELCQDIMQRWGIAPTDVVSHAQVAPGRKSDPAAPAWNMPSFRAALTPTAPPASPPYSENSPLLGTPCATAAQAVAFMLARPHGEYDDADIRDVIVWTYWEVCASVGIDPVLAVAQMIHETGNLTSFWSQRPQRNPAGVGVTGTWSDAPAVGYAYNHQRGRWEAGVRYRSWREDACPDHVGRLLCYAIPLGGGTDVQNALIARAIATRKFPDAFRGSAPRIKALGKAHNPKGRLGAGWAHPGDGYGLALAKVANAICEVQV